MLVKQQFLPVRIHVAEAVDFAGVVGMHVPPFAVVVPSYPLPTVVSHAWRRVNRDDLDVQYRGMDQVQ